MRLGRRGKVYDREILYEQWTGCPDCGYRPDARPVERVDLLRVGITNNIGRRNGQYSKEHAYYDQVNVITLRHHRPGTSRKYAEKFEGDRIERDRPPFNVDKNPDYRLLAAERSRILGEPVHWVDRGREAALSAKRVGKLFVALAAAAAAGCVATLVGLAVYA